MVGQSGFLARALFFIGCCISVECVFSETPGLRLKGVPNRLVLPAPAGTNLILTATLTSGSARTVWLAKKKDSKLRLFLTKVGDREYQINLADAEVAGALRAAVETPGPALVDVISQPLQEARAPVSEWVA